MLTKFRFAVTDEDAMQRGISLALDREGVKHQREVRRGSDRIDFVVGRVGIECKVDGSTSALTRQLFRYSEWAELDELLVVTSLDRHRSVPSEINGKPVTVHLARGMF
jgi:hypothetical protein